MKHSPIRLAPTLKPWLLTALVALPLSSACSEDEGAPKPRPTYALEVVDLDGKADVASPHCDGTLAVTVAIVSDSAFTLRPPHACGSSGSCGYFRVEALTSDDEVLARIEAVTATALLQIEPTRLPELARVRASLVRGFDGELVTNPDGAEVTTLVEPAVELPMSCEDTGSGGAGGQPAGGAGGQGGEPTAIGGAGGQGGEPTTPGGAGGVPDAGGAGGASGGEAPGGAGG